MMSAPDGCDDRGVDSDSLVALAAAVLRVDREPERVLEVCCGEGDGTLFLAREFPTARVRGLDRSEKAIRAAVARVGLDPEGRVAFKAGSPSSLPYPEEFFDLVVHSRGRLRPKEMRRVLRPGGQLIVLLAQRGGTLEGLRRRRLVRALERRGFEQMAGEESEAFLVARLGGAG
jgi:ubiquinone/menaquinone biosynthesis C-methylase UbiE